MALEVQRFFALLRDAEACPDAASLKLLLDRECGGDPDLRQRVEAAVRSRKEPTRFIVSEPPPPAINPPASLQPPDPPRTEVSSANGANPFGLPFLERSSKPGSLGRIGHYEVHQILGSGGCGVVLKAHDEMLHRIVAIKIMSPVIAANDLARRRFLREARAAAAVRHINVVQVYAVQESPTPYLVMEFIPGKTLQQQLDQHGALPLRDTLEIGTQIAVGLAASHERGLIHRDIKPANILIEEGNPPLVKITDFGLARQENDLALTQEGMVAGTPMYMAPEQARGEKMDARTDLFSFGSVLYYMVCGHPPFVSGTMMGTMRGVSEDEPDPIEATAPETPRWLSDLIRKLHEKKPENRYASATEVASRLRLGLAELDSPPGATEVVPLDSAAPPNDPLRSATEVVKAQSIASWNEPTANALRPTGPKVRWRWLLLPGLVLFVLLLGEITGVTRFFSGQATAPAVVEKKENKLDETPKVEPKPKFEFLNEMGMKFVRVGKGQSVLGGREGKPGSQFYASPEEFYIGAYEVTQGEWEAIMGGENPYSPFRRGGKQAEKVATLSDAEIARLPINSVTLNEVREFLTRLNAKYVDPNWKYALPTNSQWEYACRGGPNPMPEADRSSFILTRPTDEMTANDGNILGKLGRLTPVGSYPPNPLGLYDMHGNVGELCVDSPEANDFKIRGGYFNETVIRQCHAGESGIGGSKDSRGGSYGFRLVRIRK